MQITLVPIGPISGGLLSRLQKDLPGIFNAIVTIGQPISLPSEAFNRQRKQYLGDAILNRLHSLQMDADRLVGLIDQNCYARGLNFIFGQAAMNGRQAFVALPRLRSEFYGLAEDAQVFYVRVFKEVIHELGHTWGLSHCPNRKCIMHFSNMLQDTDIKGPDFCSACKDRLNVF
jgi:archaemetzincin